MHSMNNTFKKCIVRVNNECSVGLGNLIIQIFHNILKTGLIRLTAVTKAKLCVLPIICLRVNILFSEVVIEN